jgi:glucose/arabinose dehydrogenase
VVLLAVVALAAGAFAYYGKGRGWRAWVAHRYFGGPVPFAERPAVTETRPAHYDGSVPLDAFVAADVMLPNDGYVVDAKSVRPDTVRLFRTADKAEVAAAVNTSGGGDAIVLRPRDPLEPNTQYTFEVNAGVRDTAGAAFRYFTSNFTTAAAAQAVSLPVSFEKVALPAADGEMFTSLAIGPDRRLYASTMDGRIVRYAVRPDGTLAEPFTISSVQASGGGPRLVIGICFDPSSTADAPVLWVSHGQLVLKEATDWTGKISRLSGSDLGTCQDYVVGLPRAVRDHLNNQPVFGPDGAIYFCQASNTAMGAPDARWGMRPERKLTAAVLRFDPSKVKSPPLDARTDEGGTYDPSVPGAPLTVYATGVRNAYDLAWHENGRLYAPLNASAAGGNAPASPTAGPSGSTRVVPALSDVRRTLEDYLVRVDPGSYHGHPNPLRGQFVLNGGNPSPAPDPAETPEYPVGVAPESAWRPPVYSFGKNLAPTGVIAYRNADAFGGLLRGKLLVCRYSGGDDILVLSLGDRGEVTEAVSGIDGFTRLMDPLDLVEDPASGNLYVAEFQPKRLTLLRPKVGAVSARVFRQPNSASDAPHASTR